MAELASVFTPKFKNAINYLNFNIMKILLTDQKNKRQVQSVRSQIKDKASLKKFDEFLAKHDVFDFNNDEHINALRKNGDKNGDVNVSISVKLK